ncbi:MAG TPA: glycosyltransferase [Bacillota bacterium]|nr:glycosyltransferase [Bacillota bacterium]
MGKLKIKKVDPETCDILILSASYGGGHNQVARTLTQSIQSLAPETRITTVNYNDLLLPFVTRLTQFGYFNSIRHFPFGYALYYRMTGEISPESFWQKRLNRMGYAELLQLVKRLQPRLIIATFPLPAGVLSEMKGANDINVPLVTVITDICVHSQWIHPYTDLYIVGASEQINGLNSRGIPKNRIVATGIPIKPDFNRHFDPAEVRREFKLRPDSKVVLFMGGNDGLFGNTNLTSLFGDLPDNVQVLVISGNNNNLYDKLQTLKPKLPNLIVLKFVEQMAGLMEIADVLVTKAGGITISEALARGLPMVIYKPLPGHEESNANYLWRKRAAIIAKSDHRLKTAVRRMVADEDFLQRFRLNCRKLGSPESAETCARLILGVLPPPPRYNVLAYPPQYSNTPVPIKS